MNATRPRPAATISSDLRDDEHRALAVDVGELSRVAGEEQERQDEDGADERQLRARAFALRRRVHGQHRDDDLEQVVVEGAEELRPEERLQAPVLQRVAVGVRRHVESPVDGRIRPPGHTIGRWTGGMS